MEELRLLPRKGVVLVEIAPEYQFVKTPDKRYSTSTSGVVVAISPHDTEDDVNDMNGRRVFYEEYKDSTQTVVGSKKYAFIKLEDIRGYDRGE